MPTVSVLLVCRDDQLIRHVRDVIAKVGDLELDVVPNYDEFPSRKRWDDVGVVLAHLAERDDGERISGLLRILSNASLATVVIGDSSLALQGLALLRQGAADFLERPLDVRRLCYLLSALTARARYQAAQAPRLIENPDSLKDHLFAPQGQMARVIEQIRRVAPVATNVLLQGETGTGKTRLARVIHDLSPRRDLPFLVVNCAALSANLIESEMFGHVRGAFTGAERDRTGKFAEAGGGTLLLDEIDSLPMEIQAKLLRVVEGRAFEPVGSNRSQRFEARLIVATNRQLDREVDANRFRADLYFRINVVAFDLPPLRDENEILPTMVSRFVQEFSEQAGRAIPGCTTEAMDALMGYSWPGNVRELRNVIERAVALRMDGQIDLTDLTEPIKASVKASNGNAPAVTATTLAETRFEVEASFIAKILHRNKNNRLRTASELGISRMTLYKKLHQYGLIGNTA